MPRMAKSALCLLVAAVCATPTASVTIVANRGLRGVSDVHRGSAKVHVRTPQGDAQHRSEAPKDPLYKDFLHIINRAAAKALDLHKKDQVETDSYKQFLKFMKKRTEKAYHQQVELPSYDDFLSALKESVMVALKKPSPKYADFLRTLEAGAEFEMQKRVFHELNETTIAALSARYSRSNPLGIGNHPFKTKSPKKESTDKLRNELQRVQQRKQAGKAPKKPLMKRINVLRTQLCWQRPNLWQHEKCLRFLGINCMEASSGEGICRQFAKKTKEKCKTAKDPAWREQYCALGEALADRDNTDSDEHAEGASAVSETKEEEQIDVGSDEDLDEELTKEDKDLGGAAKGNAKSKGADGKNAKAGQNKTDDGMGDRDGDGIIDKEDAFADDPNEWKDTDKDGIGDNADKDRDGDGHDNAVDVFPNDKNEWVDSDHDGVGDNADKDADGDGTPNGKDKFPADPTEWKDSDNDGVGDNKDHYPFNPDCHSAHEPCNNVGNHTAPKPNSPEDPASLDMNATRKLPPQGYNEAVQSSPALVNHANYYTYVSDWQDEFPEMASSETNTMSRICKEHPRNIWCVRFKNKDAHFR